MISFFITESLRVMNEDLAKSLNMKPGQKLCPTCRHKVMVQDADSSSVDSFAPVEANRASFDNSASLLGCSPIKLKTNTADRVGYGKRKLKEIENSAKEKVAEVLDISITTLNSTKLEGPCNKCKDLDTFITLLKYKIELSSTQEKIKLLTLTPISWTIPETMENFNVSEHLVKKSRKLKQNKGILADPDPMTRSTSLNPEIISRVILFYQSDEFSRMCPGKKEFVSVKTDEGRVHKQKRLLLVNLKELHLEYLNNTGDKIGISKFCELRPKWCVSVNSNGMHYVCLCEQHQNGKLLVVAIPQNKDYKEILSKMVCDIENKYCMMNICENCPGKNALKVYLEIIFSDENIDLDDDINYKQWVRTDRTALITHKAPLSEFLDIFCEKFYSLKVHHFIAKTQSAFLTSCKENLADDSIIILLDFAENYSFIVQDAVQGFHWNNSQATIHPFVMYYKEDNNIKFINMCIVSDCMNHDAKAVHAFISTIMEYIKEKLPLKQKVMYFSDGASSQYKNFNIFANLCYHKIDNGIEAQWHFFATSHGKSPCDGLGGTTKRLVARASLQSPENDQILTPLQLFDWADKHISGIKFFYISAEHILNNEVKYNLEERYSKSKTISGTRSHHCFIPLSESTLEIKRLSTYSVGTKVFLGDRNSNSSSNMVHSPNSEEYQPGIYIACMYDEEWYIGIIVEKSEECRDVYVKFMRRSNAVMLVWPQDHGNECWIPFQDILCIISSPEPQGYRARQYKLKSTDYDLIVDRVSHRI